MSVTLPEVLRLPVLHGARVVAGRRGLEVPVRWCHVAEVLDIARLLSGGELLLTTGLALDVPAAQQATYIAELKARGVAALMLELGRKFQVVPLALAKAADAEGLPLVALPFDTPFVKVTEAVHGLILARQAMTDAAPADGRAGGRLLADLLAGRITGTEELMRRGVEAGLALTGKPWLSVLVVDRAVAPEGIQAAAAMALGPGGWLIGHGSGEGRLVVFGSDPERLAHSLQTLALGLAPVAAGASRCYPEPREVPQALAEARQTMRLRRRRPELPPLFAETGVYQLAAGRGSETLQAFVTEWLGPLLQYDRLHKSDLAETLRQLLDGRTAMRKAAANLHVTRQGLYHRQERIAALLERDLEDAEVRLALAVALRFWDVVREESK